ncbi:MAG: ATP-binding protein [Anaerolineales bacterium]
MNVGSWGFRGSFYLALPARDLGYVLIAAYLLLFVLALRHKRFSPSTKADRNLFLGLLASAPFAAALLAVQFPVDQGLASPGQPIEPAGATFPLFGAVPWVLAAGLLGEPHAIAVAFLGGLAHGGWMTQRLATPFSVAAQAAIFAWLMRRSYADWPGRLAARPLPSALAVGLLFGVMHSFENFAYSSGDFFAALDYALSLLGPTILASVLQMAIAGVLAESLRTLVPWHRPVQSQTGPYNRSLSARMVTVIVTLGIIGGAALTYGNWLLARSSATEIISDQMEQTAHQAGEGIPFFIHTGRTQIRDIAANSEGVGPGDQFLTTLLADAHRSLTFFTRLAVLDSTGAILADWPQGSVNVPAELLAAAQTGVPQEIGAAPDRAGEGVQLIFLSPVSGSDSSVVGWADLARNPLLQPVLARLEAYRNGQALIVDARGRAISHPDPDQWLKQAEFAEGPERVFFEATSSGGARSLVYSHPVEGYPWRVIVSTPRRTLDTLAFSTTANLFILLVTIGGVLIVGVNLMSRRLMRPLRQMASTAESIALGNLDHHVSAKGEDEIGRLSTSFEHMRVSLKSRLDELNLLLATSQSMSASFDLDEALPAVLGKIRDLTGAETVRLVLASGTFHAGQGGRGWDSLDDGILQLSRSRGQFALENPARASAVLDMSRVADRLESLIAIPVTHEEEFLGPLWLGFRSPRVFAASETKLLSIFASQLGLSLANVGLYHRAERERSRLMTILESTPDAVIVTDSEQRISLANPAAEEVLAGRATDMIGKSIEEAIGPAELRQLLTRPTASEQALEIKADGGRVLYAVASEVPGGQTGRVAVLSDVTQFKILDTLKSEFVSTVSHDLRAPLTLMRGYTTMLSNVGPVNDQQQEFLDKILTSVDRMSKLVDDLLDLGRIETGIGLSPEPVEIPLVTQDILATFRPQALNKRVSLEIELDDAMEPIQADPMLLRQAVSNLVDNAIKYTESGGRVILRAEQVDGRQIVQVEDTGVGIAPTDQPRLFEKFFRLGKDDSKGSGLGLAIVKSIIEQHHGRVSVESRLGLGSKFTIAIPMLIQQRQTTSGRMERS